jgi:transcriptional regulator with XRE-family HTH domain
MSEWQKFRDQLLAGDEEVRQEYERLGPVYELIADVIRLRHARGFTQEQLAQKMGKQQPAIARLEAGRVSPSLAFLQELAQALDARLTVRLESNDELAGTVVPASRKVRT